MASKNENILSNSTEPMDDDKSSIPAEENQQYSERPRPGLAGPMNLSVCIGFILMCHTNTPSDEHFSVDTNRIVDMLSTNNADIDDEIDRLQEFANQNLLNLYTCIINQNEKRFYNMNATSVEENQTWSRVCLVFDKNNHSFYVFYVRDNNEKNHTMFSMDDTHILKLFENSVEVYTWPGDFATVKQISDQDISMTDEGKISTSPIDYNKVNREKQSEMILNASGACNLLIQNIQNLINYIGPQLNKYQIPDQHLMMLPNPIREALTFQMQQLLEISDLAVDIFTINRKASTSVESDDARNIVLNESSNNHEQDILSNDLILTQASVPNTNNNSKNKINLSKLKLVNQPTRCWHHRNLEELRDNRCPAVHVEGHGQRASLQLQFPENIKEYKEEILTFKMINLYQNNVITKTLIKNKKLKWCRLMFAIYVKLTNGQFECVSSPIFSDLIKETYGAQSVKIDSVFPSKLCERGGQMIFVPLKTTEEKHNLDIKCNDKELNDSGFQIAGTILSFESPVCMQGSENLHVIIHSKNTENRIDFTLPYHIHDNHPDPCGVVNED
ncbi:unnamed protein product [Rotaria sp. Silwood1]|nr:unnamed protein product [Rotaria sp. Silwood1]